MIDDELVDDAPGAFTRHPPPLPPIPAPYPRETVVRPPDRPVIALRRYSADDARVETVRAILAEYGAAAPERDTDTLASLIVQGLDALTDV